MVNSRSDYSLALITITALPTLVLIPGTLCDARVFKRQKQALRGVANVLILDYYGLRNLGQWATQLLKNLPARFSVAGFSLGGLWALELLRLAPERVQRIAMIASNAQAASPGGQRKSAWLWKMWRDRGPGEVAKNVKPAGGSGVRSFIAIPFAHIFRLSAPRCAG